MPNIVDKDDVCRMRLRQVWDEFGLTLMLNCLADIIATDAWHLEKAGGPADEVKSKVTLAADLRRAAGNLENPDDWVVKT